MNFLEKVFHLKENKTDIKTEVMAGITTFMTMAYILAVNPNILSESGMDRGAVFTATAVASFLATCLMALLSNYPFVLAPGMGLNAYFSYTVVIGMGYSWQMALADSRMTVLLLRIGVLGSPVAYASPKPPNMTEGSMQRMTMGSISRAVAAMMILPTSFRFPQAKPRTAP